MHKNTGKNIYFKKYTSTSKNKIKIYIYTTNPVTGDFVLLKL